MQDDASGARPDDRRRDTLRNVAVARVLAVPIAVVATLAYPGTYPDGIETALWITIALLTVEAVALWPRRAVERVGRLAALSLAADALVVTTFTWLFAFDPTSAIFASFFVVVVEGAFLFGGLGALGTWAVLAGGYLAREVWAVRFDDPFEVDEVVLRMGLVLLVAIVVGRTVDDLDRERARAMEALAEADRVGHWRQRLVAMLAHDIRSPLAAITSGIATVDRHLDRLDPEDVHEMLRAARSRADRLGVLARDLLDLASADEGRLVVARNPVAVEPVVRGAIDLLGDLADEVVVDVAEDVVALADHARLEQVLVNLVGNAFRHGLPPVLVRARADDRDVVVEVCDHGGGIDPAVADQLFAPFEPGGRPDSTGLGLWVVSELVLAMQGTVEYLAMDAGPCFRVRLPAASPTTRPVANA